MTLVISQNGSIGLASYRDEKYVSVDWFAGEPRLIEPRNLTPVTDVILSLNLHRLIKFYGEHLHGLSVDGGVVTAIVTSGIRFDNKNLHGISAVQIYRGKRVINLTYYLS